MGLCLPSSRSERPGQLTRRLLVCCGHAAPSGVDQSSRATQSAVTSPILGAPRGQNMAVPRLVSRMGVPEDRGSWNCQKDTGAMFYPKPGACRSTVPPTAACASGLPCKSPTAAWPPSAARGSVSTPGRGPPSARQSLALPRGPLPNEWALLRPVGWLLRDFRKGLRAATRNAARAGWAGAGPPCGDSLSLGRLHLSYHG